MNLEKEIMIFDDIIPVEEQNKLEEILLGRYFPWFYLSDITDNYKKDSQERPALSHIFVLNSEPNSSYIDNVRPILDSTCTALHYGKVNILRINANLQFPLNLKSKELDTPHIDTDKKHKVFLYYVTDNEAHTVIFNNGFTRKIKPKKGRVVMFDGSLLHTAEQPTKDIRCVINFNIECL